MKTIVAIDVGTTHVKSILFGENGEVRSISKCETPLEAKDTEIIYDPEKIWAIVKNQIDEMIQKEQSPVLGISVTGMAEAGLIMSRSLRKPLSYIIPWFSDRTAGLAEGMEPDEERVLFEKTGLRNSYKYGIYKFLWSLGKLDSRKLDSRDAVWLSICDYIVFRLTGEFVTDPTFAARTYVYDIIRHQWDERRIYEYGLHPNQFPAVLPSGAIAGTYHGIPVALAGHDHILAAFALLHGGREKVCDSVGTSETYIGLLNDPQIRFDSGLQYGPFVDGGYYYLANVPSSGHSVEWYRKTLQAQEISYEQMNEELKKLEHKPTGILYFPYLTGMGAPWYKPEYRGAILGLSPDQNSMDVLKGILEGIQYQGKWLLEIAKEYHGKKTDSLICAGGGINNETMMQIKADVLGVEVLIPAVAEATLSGAAALFLHKNISNRSGEDFLYHISRIDRVYHRNPQIAEQYNIIFKNEFCHWLKS